MKTCDVCGYEATYDADGTPLCTRCVKSLGADLSRAGRRAAGYRGARAKRSAEPLITSSSPASSSPGGEDTPSTASRDAQITTAVEGAPNVP